MQAIQTKFLGPTDFRGARIKASCKRGSIVIPYPYELHHSETHPSAVRALLAKFASEDAKKYGTKPEVHHWGKFVSGTLADGSQVHVLTGERAI